MGKTWKMFRENIAAMDSLESYFLSNLNDEPTENDPDEKPSREKRLVNGFKQPFSKLYSMFVQYISPIFDSFNTFLQAEKPMIHKLYHSSVHLYRRSL